MVHTAMLSNVVNDNGLPCVECHVDNLAQRIVDENIGLVFRLFHVDTYTTRRCHLTALARQAMRHFLCRNLLHAAVFIGTRSMLHFTTATLYRIACTSFDSFDYGMPG